MALWITTALLSFFYSKSFTRCMRGSLQILIMWSQCIVWLVVCVDVTRHLFPTPSRSFYFSFSLSLSLCRLEKEEQALSLQRAFYGLASWQSRFVSLHLELSPRAHKASYYPLSLLVIKPLTTLPDNVAPVMCGPVVSLGLLNNGAFYLLYSPVSSHTHTCTIQR